MSITKNDELVAIIRMKLKKNCDELKISQMDFLKDCNLTPSAWNKILKGHSTSFKNIVLLVRKNKYVTYEDLAEILKKEENI